MPINVNEIEAGWLYKTPNNQHRLVIGFSTDDNVVYSSVGSNYKINQFDHFESSQQERFADACSERVELFSDEDFLTVKNLFLGRNIAKMVLKD